MDSSQPSPFGLICHFGCKQKCAIAHTTTWANHFCSSDISLSLPLPTKSLIQLVASSSLFTAQQEQTPNSNGPTLVVYTDFLRLHPREVDQMCPCHSRAPVGVCRDSITLLELSKIVTQSKKCN